MKLRRNQKLAIDKILEAYDNGKSGIIIEAPTGSGKSVIATEASKRLNTQNLRGYIILSQLSLIDQYEEDFDIPVVKGIDNYICSVNEKKVSVGDCKINQYHHTECTEYCEYYDRRNKAMKSPTCIFSYQYWLIQRNYVQYTFGRRDFTIFDECHNIGNIVQEHYRVRLEYDEIIKHIPQIEDIASSLRKETNKYRIHILLRRLESKLLEIKRTREPGISPELMTWYDWIKDIHCKVQDFNQSTLKYGHHHIIKVHDGFKYSLNRKWIDDFLIRQSKFKVFLSATIGDMDRYAHSISLTNYDTLRLDNTFNFDRSPIIVNPKHQISKVPHSALNDLERIMDNHKKDKGIIHTGNYKIARIIQEHFTDKRLLIYLKSQDKAHYIKVHKESDEPTILIGPTIYEGLNLPDDLCRFNIIYKIPFPYLKDPYIQTKSQLWYNDIVQRRIIQAIGRGNRHKEDYCSTYILDKAFIRMIPKMPRYIKSRIETT